MIRSIAVCSDLHLEFGDLVLENTANSEVLILAGDILVVKNKKPVFDNFIADVCGKFKDVVYVLGNHEHYNGDIKKTHNTLKERYGHYTNLHILEQESIVLNGIRYIGATLWTDQFDRNEHSIYFSRNMNDFRVIKDVVDGEFSRFTVSKSIAIHRESLAYIQKAAAESAEPVVVVVHHGVSEKSCHPRFKNNPLNGSFYSNLDSEIESLPNTWLLVHGHTHDGFDYMLGRVRVVCNPRGYAGVEYQADEFKLKFIPIPD